MVKYLGKRTCGEHCNSECCYRQRADFWVTRGRDDYVRAKNKDMASFVRRVENAVRETPEVFGDYRNRVTEIVESGRHLMTVEGNYEQATVVSVDMNRVGACYGMQLYYACVFLSDGKPKGKKACMVHPLRPQTCKDTNMDFGSACGLERKKKK